MAHVSGLVLGSVPVSEEEGGEEGDEGDVDVAVHHEPAVEVETDQPGLGKEAFDLLKMNG